MLRRGRTLPSAVALVASAIFTGKSCDALAELLPSSNPARYIRRQEKIWLAFTSCRRATSATDTPGVRDSSTIARFSARVWR
jgi:hypothetical protein